MATDPVALVAIAGTSAQLRGLTNIEGLHLAHHSDTRTGPDRFRVSGYATAAARDEIDARGASVEVLETEEEVAGRLDLAYAGADDDEPVA